MEWKDKPLSRLSIWDSGKKSFDYRFIDREISEYCFVGGTAVYCHLYLGPHQQTYDMLNRDGSTIPAYDPNNPPPQPVTGNVSSIQDVLFLENRDRKYSDVVYELRGVYNVNDIDFNLTQFGLFLQSDTLFIEFHLNDMIALLGRKLMPGDVLELPHRRDDTLDMDASAINKFYVVEDASRPAGGYSATWWPHMWRVKCSPMPASQEFQDILNQQAQNPLGFDQGTIGSLMSTIATELGIDEAVVDQAKIDVPARYFDTRQFWMVVPEAGSNDYPWVFAGDGIPPNGAVPLGSGTRFPDGPSEGDYYLRTDYRPATLFMFHNNAWRMQEQDFRQKDWSAAHRLLESFIGTTTVSIFPDYTAPEQVNLSRVIKPRADF
jgi:hypothetical protein